MKRQRFFYDKRQTHRSFNRWRTPLIMGVLLFMAGGCISYQQKIKTYLIGREMNLAVPLRQAMLTSGDALNHLDFAVHRIEFIEKDGLIQALRGHTEAVLRFRQTGVQTTRLDLDVFTEKRSRDIASEEALSTHISERTTCDAPSLTQMTAKMIPVRRMPDPGALVIGYIREGTLISVASDQEGWSCVTLVCGGTGYISSENLTPAPNGKTTHLPEIG